MEQNSDQHKVYLGSEIFLYREKGPWTPSGFSVHGALELDGAEDKVKCHECGKWRDSLPGHIYQAHSAMDTREYKLKHGLNLNSALVNERIRGLLITQGKTQFARESAALGIERSLAARLLRRPDDKPSRAGMLHWQDRNKRGVCRAQLLEKINCLGNRLGRTPTAGDLYKARLYKESIEFVFSQPISEVLKLAGFMVPQKRELTDVILIEMLRDFYVRFKRPASDSDFNRGLLPSRYTFIKQFGRMDAAYEAAGLLSAVKEHRGSTRFVFDKPSYTREDLIGLLMQFRIDHGRWPRLHHDFSTPRLRPSTRTFRKFLGNLTGVYPQIETALRAAHGEELSEKELGFSSPEHAVESLSCSVHQEVSAQQ